MGEYPTIQGAAAGTSGALWRKILTFLATGAGSYVINNTNFAGVGVFLPAIILISLNPAGGVTTFIEVSSDNGTTWFTVASAAAGVQVGAMLWCDTASTIRIRTAGGNTDIRLFVK